MFHDLVGCIVLLTFMVQNCKSHFFKSQINELQERLRMLQQQQQQDGMNAPGSYPINPMQPMQPPPMGGMSNQGPIYGPGPNMQMPPVRL